MLVCTSMPFSPSESPKSHCAREEAVRRFYCRAFHIFLPAASAFEGSPRCRWHGLASKKRRQRPSICPGDHSVSSRAPKKSRATSASSRGCHQKSLHALCHHSSHHDRNITISRSSQSRRSCFYTSNVSAAMLRAQTSTPSADCTAFTLHCELLSLITCSLGAPSSRGNIVRHDMCSRRWSRRIVSRICTPGAS
jgi:hypothetical protein